MEARTSFDNSVRARGASISFRAAEVIREAIFAGKLRPGDSLTESELTQDLGVSQTSVREALFSLEREGLVVRIPNRGTNVVRLTEDDLRERAAVYALLESAAAVEAAGKMSQVDLGQMEHRAVDGAENPQRGSLRSFRESDLEFHRLVWRCSGNSVLIATLESVALPMFALARQRTGSHGNHRVGFRHQAIIEALGSGDKRRIVQTISEHVNRSFLSAEPGGFSVLGLMLTP